MQVSVVKTVGGEVTLLHVIENERDRAKAESTLNQLVVATISKSGVAVKGIVKQGNIFVDIGGVVETIGARLIFMGTHGVKGVQYIVGSYAVKVITHSIVPFVVVQNKAIKDGYSTIVLPMYLSKESKHKLDLTIKMAQYFKSKVHIFSQHESDEFIRKAIERDTVYARNEMRKHNIEHELHTATGKGNFVKQMLEFAGCINADLIAVVNSQERGVHELLSGTSERDTITNEAQVPVLVVKPIGISNSKISFFIAGQ